MKETPPQSDKTEHVPELELKFEFHTVLNQFAADRSVSLIKLERLLV